MSVNPILEELKKRGYQVDRNSAYRIGNASGYRSAATPYVKSYSDLLNERLQLGLQYAQQGTEYKKDLADSISPGGAMTEYKKGDWLNFDFDARQAAEIDSVKAVDYYSTLGLFDSKDFAYDKRYLHLPQTSYLSGLLPALDEEIAKSQKADVDAYNIRQQSAETSDRWLGLRNAPNETEMDRWYNMLMADYLLGDRSELFDFEAIDTRYGEMSDEEYEREYQRLTDQWNNLDWETLTGSKANNYQSKTPELQGYKQSISKELERRNALEALQASIRSDANYSTLSAYTDTYTEPDNSNWFLDTLAGNTAKYTVKGYDDLSRFLNADATFADKYIAGKDSHAVQHYLENGYDYIAPDELADYNALINSGRTEEAKQYLELLRPELLMRRANVLQSYQTVKAQNPYLAAPTWIDAGILNLENVLHLPQQIYETAKGIDSPYSAAFDALNKNQWTTSAQLDAIAESNMPDWLKTVATYGYQGVTGFRDNAMRILAGGGSPTASLIIAGLQSGSGSLHESSERDGMSGAAKIVKAIGTAAVEMGTEKVGLDALFSKGKNGALAYMKNVILSEVGEEVLNAASEPVLEAVVAFLFDHEADIMSGPEFWKNLTDTAITTAISSVFMGAGGAVSQDMNTRAAGKGLKENGDLEGVLKIAEAYGDNETVSVAAKDIRDKQAAGKEISIRDMGKLVNSVGAAIGEANSGTLKSILTGAIKDRLIQLGEDAQKAAKQADVIQSIYNGETVSPVARAQVEWSDNASQVLKEMTTDTKASKNVVPGAVEGTEGHQEDGTWVAGDALAAESQRTGKAWVTEAEAKVQAEGTKTAEQYAKFSEAMNAKRPKRPLPSASKNYTVGNSKKKAADIMAGKEKLDRNQFSAMSDDYGVGKIKGKFKRFEKADDGFKVVLESDTKSENGKPVEVKAAVSDIDNAGDAGLLTIAKYAEDDSKHQMTAEEVNIMANAYMAEVDSNPDTDVGTFIEKFEDSYTAGYIGAEAVADGISETASKIAYEQGRMESETDEANRVKRAGKVRAESKGEVSFIGKVKNSSEVKGKGDPNTLTADMKNMTNSQRTAAQIVQAFAKKFKTNVVLYESDEESVGSIENGAYDPNTNTIYIDINSGAYSAEGIESGKKHNTLGFAMVRTLGHELTHHLESTSAEGYAAYKTAVKKMLKERGEDWAMLVRGKMDSARTAGYKLTYAGAEAEVVADASEYILQNSKFAKEIDAETHSKIKRFIKGFMRKLGEVFQQLTGSHRESAALRQEINGVMQYLGDIQNLWDAAMEESIGQEVSDGVVDTAYKTGEVYSYTTQSSIRVRDEETIEFLENQQHITTYRAMQVIDGKLYPPMAEFIGSKKNGNREDPGVIGQWEMAVEHPELIKWVGGKPKFELKKTNDDGSVSTVPAAYNPYMHSSNTVLNDQFSKAFQRTNLVVVECVVPVSEIDGAYRAQYAKDATGWHEWKSGVVAGDLAKQKVGFRRDVFLSRYIKPARILSDTEVAEKIAGYLEGTDVTVPFQSAWPTLRDALVEAGVKVTEPRGLGSSQMKIAMEAYEEWKSEATSSLPRQYMARNNPFDRAVEVHNIDYRLENALTREERLQLDDRLHYRILFPEKRKGIKIGSDFAETITVHGDHTKLVVMRRDAELDVSILDVYNVNTTGYNGRIAELTKSVEEAINTYGTKQLQRWSGSFVRDDGQTLLSRYDRRNRSFPGFTAEREIRQGTQKATVFVGIGSNRAGDAGSGKVRQNSLREDISDIIDIDEDTESAAPLQYSIRTWADSDYVTRRDEAAHRLAKTIGVSVAKAKEWIDDVNSVSAYILGNKARLDYITTAVKGMSAFKSNPEYGGSIDMSTICAKRRLATGTLDAIQRVLGDAVLTKDDFLHIREMMKERGHEVACGLCFVESSRKNLSKYNKQFLDQYKAEHPDVELGMVDLNTVEGLERIRSNPETADVYAAYEKFMNKLAQRKPKLFEKRTEYNHEILKKFKSDTTVGVKNRNGGLRLQSFSDFEIVHLIDMMQVITDMASVGLAGQAYTKVPDFAWALGDTGLKINLSLIAKDVDEDGNLVFDDVEGMNHLEAEKLRNAYSKNVGTIVVTFTDEQTIAAMKSDFIDYIIPFHRSQWQKGDYKKLGLPEGTKDYTIHQNEKEGRKRVKENFLPNAYWQDDLSGTENAKYYLDMCAKAGRTPKFAKFLVNNGDGSYSLQPDGSTDGYWKLLIDFKMYDNDGNRSEQLPVQPNFNMNQAMRMLEEYKGEHDSFPVAQDVVDAFVKEYRGDVGGVKNTDGRYTVSPVQKSLRDMPEEISTREFLAEADSGIATTIEERNALSIYQKLLKNHSEASEKVIEAEAALAAADEAHKPEARKTLADARAKQKDLYNRLLNVERTAHVQTLVKRSNQIIGDLYGKDRADLDKMLSDKQRQIESLKADITGLKGAARTQRESDIREREREVAALKSKATQALLANSERYQQQIADIRLRRDINVEIGKRTRHIKRIVKRLNDRIVHEEDYKNVKEPLKPVVHKLVQTFIGGFGNMVFDTKTAGKLKSVYDMLKQEDETAEYFDEEVSDWLTTLAELARQDEERRTSGSTLENLNDKLYIYTTLSDIVDHVAHMVTAADTMFIEGKKAEASAVTEEVGNTLAAKKDRRELAGWAGKLARFADNLIVKGNMMPQFFFEGLNNKGMMHLYDDLQNGVRKYSERMLVGDEFLSGVMRKHGYHAWGGMKKPVSFKTKQGHTIYLTRENMMWIYATAKREASNPMMDTHHLDEGGVTYEEVPTEKGRQIEGKGVHHLIVAEDVAEITKMLTAEQIAYVDECVEFLSTECADWGNEASLKLFGIKKYKEGYYFPFKVDSDQLHKNSAAGATSTVSDARVKHISFSHSIKKGANTPLVMGNFTSVIADHINQMATYSGMVVPIENMSRVLNRKVDDGHENVNIRSLIARKYGDNSARYIDDLLKDLNGGPQTDNRGSLDAGLRLFKRNAVVGKLSVALQQPTAVARAFAYISPRWFANLHLERPKHTWERMMKYSSTTFLKDMGGFNVGMGKGASNWLERGDLGDYRVYKRAKFLLDQKSLKDAVGEWNDFLTGLPGFMDKITWCAIWNATENEQAHQHPNMDRNSDEFLELVGRRFDDIVNHTQVYDSILSKSQNMRSKNAIAKMATSFMAESTLNMNLAYRAIASKDGKQIAKVTSSLILNAVLGAAAYALIGAFNKDDDDRTWKEKYATAFAGRLADNLNPLASIPYLSDLWNKLQGYDVERTDMAFLLDLIEDGGKFWNKMTNPDEKLSYRDYENFVGGLISTATGIPAKNWMGDARRIWNMTHTSTEDAPLSSVWYGILDEVVPGRESTNTAYYERFLAALKDGDKQEQYDLKEYLTSTKGVKEDTVRNGVVNAYKKEYLRGGIAKNEAVDFLVKNDLVKGETADKKRQAAFKKVDEWDEGSEDYSVYNTIFDAVKKGNTSEITKGIKEMTANGYVESDVVSGVRGLIRESYMEGTMTQSQVKTAYKSHFAPKNFDVNDQNEWYWLFRELDWGKKSHNSTEGYSNYIFLKDNFSKYNETAIRNAWNELTAHGYEDKDVKTYVRTYILKPMVQEGKISTARATELLKRWAPYNKDSDNINKPQEWLKAE